LLVICIECREGGPKLLEEVEVNVADGLESGGRGTFVVAAIGRKQKGVRQTGRILSVREVRAMNIYM
jgi:hypothetical protein